ncbi:MAG: hypothetical protein NPIRA06_06020 [Nitrospirales bacterium]|nr:MAG: hypothetical protein NPIRA06_06020 [Nitrospirales bacterium]
MVKGVFILKSHLNPLVCLSKTMGFSGEKSATVSLPAERGIDQTPHHEPVNNTVGERLQMDGRREWGLINGKVPPQKKPLYDKVKTARLNGLITDIAGTGSGGAPISNRIIVSSPPRKDRNLRKALWTRLREVDMLQKDTLHVRAKGGIVTLSGIVKTEPQRTAAGKAAESVPDVKKVINVIHVETLSSQTEQDWFLKENREGLR